MSILIYPDEFLYKKTENVTDIDEELKNQINQVKDYFKETYAVGLAANQLGFNKSFFVYKSESLEISVIINPVLEDLSKNLVMITEGCLSIPEVMLPLKRPEVIVISGLDEEGNKILKRKEGIEARIIQHEIDHLNGILMIDKLSKMQKQIYKKRLSKIRAS